MREFFFSDDDLKAIAKDRYEHLHPHVQRKMEVLWRFVRKQSLNPTWFDSFEQFQAAIDDCLNKMATDHRQEAASLFVHKFQRFEDVPTLAA
jgi:hypothetical protein